MHVLGTGATDLVHIGQAVMASGAGGLDFLVTAVFNYPTFAESYKVAALDADNRIKAMKSFGAELEQRAQRRPELHPGLALLVELLLPALGDAVVAPVRARR